MNRAIIVALAVTVVTAASACAEMYVLAEMTDIRGDETYEILTSEAYQEKVQEFRTAARAYRAALRTAKQNWMKDETYGKKPFPTSAFTAPDIRSTARSVKRADLEEELLAEEERRVAREAYNRDRERDKEAERMKKRGKTWKRMSSYEKRKHVEAAQRRKEFELEKLAEVQFAASLIEDAMRDEAAPPEDVGRPPVVAPPPSDEGDPRFPVF